MTNRPTGAYAELARSAKLMARSLYGIESAIEAAQDKGAKSVSIAILLEKLQQPDLIVIPTRRATEEELEHQAKVRAATKLQYRLERLVNKEFARAVFMEFFSYPALAEQIVAKIGKYSDPPVERTVVDEALATARLMKQR